REECEHDQNCRRLKKRQGPCLSLRRSGTTWTGCDHKPKRHHQPRVGKSGEGEDQIRPLLWGAEKPRVVKCHTTGCGPEAKKAKAKDQFSRFLCRSRRTFVERGSKPLDDVPMREPDVQGS